MKRFAVFLVLACSAVCVAQSSADNRGVTVHNEVAKGIPITFHVTSVRYEQDSSFCAPGDCSATKITIEGYADGTPQDSRVSYALTCDEVWADKPTPHSASICAHVHADNDYDAKLFDTSINFWPKDKYSPPPLEALYSIVSEKEIRRQLK